MKYEYMLHTWGGFYNFSDRHGFEEGYFWFDTDGGRQEYIDRLHKAKGEIRGEMEEGIDRFIAGGLAAAEEEGEHVRLRTIASMVLVYDGKGYPFEFDFGYGYPPENAWWMFHEGNYSCDCNKSLF